MPVKNTLTLEVVLIKNMQSELATIVVEQAIIFAKLTINLQWSNKKLTLSV